MLKFKSFTNLLVLSIASIAIASCVPKATEKKAACGTNEAFNKVTRTCYSILEVRATPKATLSSVSLTQETAQQVTLTYTDTNKDLASTCSVTSVSPSLEIVSPKLVDGTIFNSVDDLYTTAYDISNALPTGSADQNDSFDDTDDISDNLTYARHSFTQTTILNKLNSIEASFQSILNRANAYTLTSTTIRYFYNIGQTRLANFQTIKTQVEGKCSCSGGVCSAYVAPKIFQSGSYGFNYTVSDQDGASSIKPVTATVVALSGSTAHLVPVSVSNYISTYAESATSTPGTYTFTLPTSSDYLGTTNFYYKYNGTVASGYGITALGKVYGCMDLTGSTGLTDKTCIYKPTSGDSNSTIVPDKAEVQIGDLVFTANKEGALYNNITIQYIDLSSNIISYDPYASTYEKYGLVSSYADSYVRVNGDEIKIFITPTITSTLDIKNLINNDAKASKLVTVTGGAGTSYPISSTVAVTNVQYMATTAMGLGTDITGSDAFDFIKFTSSNDGTNYSTNSASIMIAMAETDDPPLNPTQYNTAYLPLTLATATASTMAEDTATAQTITLPYYDADIISPVDPLKPTTCSVDFVTGVMGLQLAPLATCTCTNNVCSVDIVPQANFAGTGNFLYQISSYDKNSGATQVSSWMQVNVTVSKVNDSPSLAINSATPITMAENSTSAPSNSKICFTIGAGGGSDESAETLTIGYTQTAPTSNSNMALSFSKLNPGVSGNTCGAGEYQLTVTPTQNQSGTTNITLSVSDNGTTNSSSDPLTTSTVIAVTVTTVDDPPAFITIPTTVETNEGGAVQTSGFVVDEDTANSTDEDAQQVTIYDVTSDNSSLLPINGVRLFYDENDNGVEDTGEVRTSRDRCLTNFDYSGAGTPVGTQVPSAQYKIYKDTGTSTCYISTGTTINSWVAVPFYLESVASIDAKAHKLYMKLSPAGGVSGSANLTLKINDDNGASLSHTVSGIFAFIVNPVAAIHGGWVNISATGLKTDKTGAPASSTDLQCSYNLSGTTSPSGSIAATSYTSGNICNYDVTGAGTPVGNVTPSASNKLYWDSTNSLCYRSTGVTTSSWTLYASHCPITSSELAAAAPNATTSGEYYYDTTQSKCFYSTAAGTTSWSQFYPNVLYYDTNQGKCYRGSGTSINSWVEFKTACPVKNYQILSHAPYKAPSAKGEFYYNTKTSTCYVSNGTTTASWEAFTPSKVSLTWNSFTMNGSGLDYSTTIEGWNVYRREPGTDYDFTNGFLKPTTSSTKTITSSTTLTYTDTTAVAGKVYFYTVRPIDSRHHLPTATSEIFSEVRVIAPAANYAFVHRWMINQEICNSMHMTTTSSNPVDPTHNYRCPYEGPGESTASPGYYDYGKDLLVDIAEVGCAYTSAPSCSSDGCIGIGDPTTLNPVTPDNTNDVYYDRDAGTCYKYNGAAWSLISTASINATVADKLNSSLNPPLVNVTSSDASSICSNRNAPTIAGLTLTTASLPEKKDYMAYSAFPLNKSDAEMTDIEKGESLSTYSRCNGTNANGLEFAYTAATIPSTSYLYSIPGTSASGIRSLFTGSIPWVSSKGTETCSSRYGVQDVYGNVAEWVKDQMDCKDNGSFKSVCQSVAGTSMRYDFNYDYTNSVVQTCNFASSPKCTGSGCTDTLGGATPTDYNADGAGTSNDVSVGDKFYDSTGAKCWTWDGIKWTDRTTLFYGFDLMTGPYLDTDANGVNDDASSYLTDWDLRDELNDAGKFSFPLGLPVYANLDSDARGYSSLLDIGPTSGITSTQLHEDGIIVNGSDVNTNGTLNKGTFAVGGSYLSGNRAGRYSMELVPDSDKRSDVGLRCVVPIPNSAYTGIPSTDPHPYKNAY